MANKYIRDLTEWPAGQPIPGDAQFIFYDAETDNDYRVTAEQVGANGGSATFRVITVDPSPEFRLNELGTYALNGREGLFRFKAPAGVAYAVPTAADDANWHQVASLYNDTAVQDHLQDHDERLNALEVGGKCILVAANSPGRYYASYPLAAAAMVAGETLEVYGVQDYTSLPFIANYANGSIWLAPGAVLKAQEFYVHTAQLTICGPGRMDIPRFSIEPGCLDFLMKDATLNGHVVPYSFGGNGMGRHRFERCTINAGAYPVYEALYDTNTGFTVYAQAEFTDCQVTTTAASVFKFSRGGAVEPADAENNRLRLINNTITAPADAVAVDDASGGFTFEQGVNTYVNVAPPTKTAATNVVSFPCCGETTPAPSITDPSFIAS